MKAETRSKSMGKYETKIKGLIKSTNNNSDDYDEEYIKMKFNPDDDLPVKKKKKLKLYGIVTVVSSIFNDGSKYYHKYLR